MVSFNFLFYYFTQLSTLADANFFVYFCESLFSLQVVLSLAKMELENFFKSVMPVADYFDQSDMLVAVSIARNKAWETEKKFQC